MPYVLKRSGTPEPFDEDRLRRGIEHAIFKRPVPPDKVDHAIENVMRKLRAISRDAFISEECSQCAYEDAQRYLQQAREKCSFVFVPCYWVFPYAIGSTGGRHFRKRKTGLWPKGGAIRQAIRPANARGASLVLRGNTPMLRAPHLSCGAAHPCSGRCTLSAGVLHWPCGSAALAPRSARGR
eukprot:gene13261-16913_t